MGSSLNKTSVLYLKNNSGQSVTKGDCVVLDKTLADAFTVTGSVALSNTQIGVVMDQTLVASGQSCLVAIDGYVPVINLISGSNIGDTFYLSSVAKQAQPHGTQLSGDFGQTLSVGTTPEAILWGTNNAIPSDFLQVYYTGGNISLGTAADSGFVDVSTSNAKITFIPKSSGKYKVTFIFSVYVDGTANVIEQFRLTDGVTNSLALEISFYTAGGPFESTVVVTYVFNWLPVLQTVKLQKLLYVATSVTNNLLLADAYTGGIAGFTGRALYMLVERIGS